MLDRRRHCEYLYVCLPLCLKQTVGKQMFNVYLKWQINDCVERRKKFSLMILFKNMIIGRKRHSSLSFFPDWFAHFLFTYIQYWTKTKFHFSFLRKIVKFTQRNCSFPGPYLARNSVSIVTFEDRLWVKPL